MDENMGQGYQCNLTFFLLLKYQDEVLILPKELQV